MKAVFRRFCLGRTVKGKLKGEKHINNIYYREFAPLLKKAAVFNDDSVWGSIYKALTRLEPDKNNFELRRHMTECFERLEAESDDDKLSLFFLSFLFQTTGNARYLEEFLKKCLNSARVPKAAKVCAYYYCHAVLQDRLYFNTENITNLMEQLFVLALSVAERFLASDINALKSGTPKTALFIASSLGSYPFGIIKHMLDTADFLIRRNYTITVMITRDGSFTQGGINLYPIVYNYGNAPDVSNAEGIALLKNLDKNIKIHEFDTKNTFIHEAKRSLALIGEAPPAAVMNFSGKSVFATLLGHKFKMGELADLSPENRPEHQKISADLIKKAEKYLNDGNYAEVCKLLLKALDVLKNNESKAKACEQLARAYILSGESGKALEAARGFALLEDSPSSRDALCCAFEAQNDNKNAIYLRENILKDAPFDYTSNLKLFKLYLDEKQFEKAEEKNDFFKNEPNLETMQLSFRFYHKIFDEESTLITMHKILELLKESGDKNLRLNNLFVFISSSLYYDLLDDAEYTGIINELYNEKTPLAENAFNGYKHKEKAVKLGFITGEVAYHPVGYFISSIFKANYESGRFDYYFYFSSDNTKDDDNTDLLKEKIRVLRYLGGMKNDEAAAIILKDELDILIDLNGISDKSIADLLINRLAPVQMTWIGFPCTLPIKNMDYNIADRVTDPAGISEKFYTEKLLYLPKTFLCYGIDTDTEITEAPFLKNKYITFGSFNNGNKYSNAILKIWAELLTALPDARLIIRTRDVDNAYTKQKLIDKFAKNGIDTSRVDFLPGTYRAYYYSSYNEVDIILDTYPFNGATTTCDAFLMGKPIISLYGNRHVSRVGLSMLTSIGYPELAAGTGEEYVEKAVALSRNTAKLSSIIADIREKALTSPLFNHDEFKKDFEEAIYETYQRHFDI